MIQPYKVFLSGLGGTGKSHCINLICRDVNYFFRLLNNNIYGQTKIEDDKPLILLTAPTGSAAFQIGGLTLHAALQLSQNNHLSYEKKAILVNYLSQLKVLACDEISMVGSPCLADMNSQLCMINNSADVTKYDFGMVSILAIGDLYQLPPVKSCPIFKHPSVIHEPGDLAPLPWHDFKLHELTQVMRQKDQAFADVLNVVWVQVPEKDSFVDKILKSRELTVDENDPSYPKDAMHVYAHNEHARARNNKRIQDLEGTMYTSTAKDFKKDVHANVADVTFSTNPNETGNLLGVLQVKVGARVMLTTNVDVTDGLTNGAMGTVTNVVCTGNKIDVILVQFDNPSVGERAIMQSKFKHIDASAVPVYQVQVTFAVRGKSFQGCRIQFPLFLSWSVSIHKCQGLTLDEIVVDMTPKKGSYQ